MMSHDYGSGQILFFFTQVWFNVINSVLVQENQGLNLESWPESEEHQQKCTS